MKCVLKIKGTDKNKILSTALMSCECKVKNGYTYLWYHLKRYAKSDLHDLNKAFGVQTYELLNGWEVDGFATLKL